MIRNFTQFSVMDFAEEDSFIRWARHGDPVATAFWEQWLKDHPEKAADAKEAFRLLRSPLLLLILPPPAPAFCSAPGGPTPLLLLLRSCYFSCSTIL
jgi:hypothetical protein